MIESRINSIILPTQFDDSIIQDKLIKLDAKICGFRECGYN